MPAARAAAQLRVVRIDRRERLGDREPGGPRRRPRRAPGRGRSRRAIPAAASAGVYGLARRGRSRRPPRRPTAPAAPPPTPPPRPRRRRGSARRPRSAGRRAPARAPPRPGRPADRHAIAAAAHRRGRASRPPPPTGPPPRRARAAARSPPRRCRACSRSGRRATGIAAPRRPEPGDRDVHEAHRLLLGPAVGAGHAGHADAEVGAQPVAGALGHRDRDLRGHRAVRLERRPPARRAARP